MVYIENSLVYIMRTCPNQTNEKNILILRKKINDSGQGRYYKKTTKIATCKPRKLIVQRSLIDVIPNQVSISKSEIYSLEYQIPRSENLTHRRKKT